jgi:hypothetical protein
MRNNKMLHNTVLKMPSTPQLRQLKEHPINPNFKLDEKDNSA